MCRVGNYPGNKCTNLFHLGGKYWEIPGHIGKYWEIPGKYQEITRDIHTIVKKNKFNDP